MDDSTSANGSPAVKTKAERARASLFINLQEFALSLVLARAKDEEILQLLDARSKASPSSLNDDEIAVVVKNAKKEAKHSKAEQERDVLQRMNRSHAIISLGGKVVVMNEIYDHELGREAVTFSAIGDINVLYSNRSVGGKNWSKFWLDHPYRRQYSQLVFDPGRNPPKGAYNLWKGFSVEAKAGNCSLFLAHIKNIIAAGNADANKYILDWCAHLVQTPQIKPGVAIVLRGGQGIGKGTFVSALGSLMAAHYHQISDTSRLVGRFNAHFKNLLLLFADEAFWAGDKAGEGVLKALITEQFSTVEHKGQDSVQLRNYLRVMMASNSDWVAPLDMDDRRYFVVDVSEERKQDTGYFSAINEELENGGYAAFLDFLQRRDIKNVDIRRYPMTAAILEQKMQSLNPLQGWWHDVLVSGNHSFPGDGNVPTYSCFIDEPFTIPCDSLYSSYRRFGEQAGRRNFLTPNQFGTGLAKLVPKLNKSRPSIAGGRVRCYEFPSIMDCRAHFDKIMKTTLDWQD